MAGPALEGQVQGQQNWAEGRPGLARGQSMSHGLISFDLLLTLIQRLTLVIWALVSRKPPSRGLFFSYDHYLGES